MKKHFLKGLLIKIASEASAYVLVFSAFVTQAAAFLLMLIQVPFFSRGTLMKNVIQPAQPRF